MRQRAVIATTHIDRHSMIVTKDTLEAFAEQINGGSRPLITVEHDVTLPPYGKTVKAWVQPRDDGEFELVVENEIFDQVLWAELTDGTRLFKQESETDRYPFADRYEDQTGDVFLSYDRINFDSEENIKSFIEDIRNHSKLEFSANEFGRKSYILDPEFLIRIAKAVGTYLIAKNVLNKTGDKVLELASEDIAKSYIFLKSLLVQQSSTQGRKIGQLHMSLSYETSQLLNLLLALQMLIWLYLLWPQRNSTLSWLRQILFIPHSKQQKFNTY
jgi:hypothetical protein